MKRFPFPFSFLSSRVSSLSFPVPLSSYRPSLFPFLFDFPLPLSVNVPCPSLHSCPSLIFHQSLHPPFFYVAAFPSYPLSLHFPSSPSFPPFLHSFINFHSFPLFFLLSCLPSFSSFLSVRPSFPPFLYPFLLSFLSLVSFPSSFSPFFPSFLHFSILPPLLLPSSFYFDPRGCRVGRWAGRKKGRSHDTERRWKGGRGGRGGEWRVGGMTTPSPSPLPLCVSGIGYITGIPSPQSPLLAFYLPVFWHSF